MLRRQLRTLLQSANCQSLPISMCLILFRRILQRCYAALSVLLGYGRIHSISNGAAVRRGQQAYDQAWLLSLSRRAACAREDK
jgi:hypothetical protein